MTVVAAAREYRGQVAFFQSCALPAELVETLHSAEIDRNTLRALAQWRLDFPLARGEGLPPQDRNLVAVAEALLTRGTTPFCSRYLEKVLGFGERASADVEAVVEAVRCVGLLPTARFRPVRFSSREEQAFCEWLTARIEVQQLPWIVVPEVELASIFWGIDPESKQRGDFLLVHPECKPVLVEVDGAQHESHGPRDRDRDRALELNGVRTVRIPANEIRAGRGPLLDKLTKILLEGRSPLPHETELSRILRYCKFFHQIQLSLLTALRNLLLRLDAPWSIGIALPYPLRHDAQAVEIALLAVSDLMELLARLGRVHGRPVSPGEPRVVILESGNDVGDLDLLIGPADGTLDGVLPSVHVRFLVSDVCFPVELQAPLTAATPLRAVSPSREDARWFLQYLFRKEDFWEGQWETIERTLRGLDSVVLLPTGAGKSIAFQLAALLLPGRCVVVDPIISLIDDQIDNLAAVGIDRCVGITSQLTTEERELALQAFKTGHYLFCYVAPERFQTIPFREALRALTTNTPISVIAIDEAHCVSEWGHDFRTAYLNLGRITREYCASHGLVPPLVALTGTASKIVLKDVQRELGITAFDAVISPTTFDRPELRYTILTCRSEEKQARVLGFLERLPTDFGITRNQFFQVMGKETHAGLVFCPHVNGPYGVVQQAEYLRQQLKTQVGVYSGEPPKESDPERWETIKRRVALDFKRNRLVLLACTKAFGMGIDKPNIRYTVHIGLPASIEAFYQEAGRAGRDRRRAECAIILSNDNPRRSQYLLSPATPLNEIARMVNQTHWDDADDIIRALWFHVRAFRGQEVEVSEVASTLDRLGDLTSRHQVNITWDDGRLSSERGRLDFGRERVEKALHRLVVMGVVEDYTVNFSSREFSVLVAGATQADIAEAVSRYVGAYQQRLGEQMRRELLALRQANHRAFVLAVARRLIDFIYQHVEMARRRALNEMLQAATSAQQSGEKLRQRILNYLEQSEWDERLELVRSSALGGVDRLAPLLDDLVSPNDAVALRAATGRALASYPDVPGLLVLRALTEALSADANSEVVRQNIEAALQFGLQKFQLDPKQMVDALAPAISRACDKAGAGELILDAILASKETDRVLVRELVRYIPPPLAASAARWLLARIKERCKQFLTKGGRRPWLRTPEIYS